MKNREKFVNELVEIALNDGILAVNKNTGMVVGCSFIGCGNCLFKGDCNSDAKNAWAESEWKEPITVEAISNKFIKFCTGNRCTNCKYLSVASSTVACPVSFILDNYDVKEKEKTNDR